MKWKTATYNTILYKLKFNSSFFKIYKLIMNLELMLDSLIFNFFLYLMNHYKYDIILRDKRRNSYYT